MQINFNGAITGGIAIYFIVKKWLEEMAKVLEPVIQEMERLAQDKLIDKADRKIIAIKTIEGLRKANKIKISPLMRLLLPFLVDWIANKLPDFTVCENVKEAAIAAQFNK